MKKLIISIIASCLVLVLFLSNYGQNQVVMVSSIDIDSLESAKSYIVMDSNGFDLIEHNSDEKKEVASICKLMTTLITLENIDKGNIALDDKFLASDYACMVEGSQAFLDAGCEYTVRDLLKSVIVASANDSAIVLAENIAGSEAQFVDLMNAKAKEIGMENTIYANSTGLHDNNTQYSTARDTAKILNKISNYEVYQEYCKIWMDILIHPSGRQTELVNTNRLIKYYPYTLTGKTGYTDEAGYCLSSTAQKDSLKLTCVVLGCDSSADRFSDSVELYNHAFANFRNYKIIDKSVPLDKSIVVNRGSEDSIKLVYEDDYYLTCLSGEEGSFQLKYNIPNYINAPIKQGQVVGSVEIVVDDTIIGQVNIIAQDSVERQTYKDVINKIVDNFAAIK